MKQFASGTAESELLRRLAAPAVSTAQTSDRPLAYSDPDQVRQ